MFCNFKGSLPNDRQWKRDPKYSGYIVCLIRRKVGFVFGLLNSQTTDSISSVNESPKHLSL